VRILDPACGSGNFLYLALQSLKDLERRVIVEAHEMGLPLGLRGIHCGPHNVKGIEINSYAAELARTAIWIGNIQWLRRNGFEARKEPVLEDLDSIECRDALVTKITSPACGRGRIAEGGPGEGLRRESEHTNASDGSNNQLSSPVVANQSSPAGAHQ